MSEIILVVDDNKVNRRLLSVILKKAGYEVIEAEDGPSAIATAQEIRPDLILLDIMMPEMDGYEVCRILKSNPDTDDIPIIFLSAKAETEDKIKGLEIGGADYVTKPFDKGEVVARVRSQLRIRSLTKELIEANRELRKKQQRLDEDLEAAAGIQRSLLPQKPPKARELEAAWKFQPCESIGGDIFNIARLDEHHYSLYMLDVSGHGVPSALVTVSVSQMLQPQTGNIVKKGKNKHPYYEISPPGQVLETLDRIMAPREVLARLDKEYPIERFDKFFTIVYMLVNVTRGQLIYSNAGHPYPLLLHRDGSFEKLTVGGPIIGLGGVLPFEDEVKDLLPGDQVILYTDGVVEQPNEEGEFFGEERLEQLVRNSVGTPIDQLLDQIMEAVLIFAGSEKLKDDISLLGFQYNGSTAGHSA